MNDDNSPLHAVVGFDYVAALKELLNMLTYEELAYRTGYRSVGAIASIVKRGHVPNHKHGEAIWVLYVELFGRKPPMTATQASGSEDAAILNNACSTIKTSVQA